LVDRLAGYGYSVAEISLLTGLRSSTIYRHFREELTTSALKRDLDVIESAYFQATGGPANERDWRRADASMTRFWLGQRRGWRMPSANDKVIRQELDLDRLSEDELHELERLLGRAGDEDTGSGGVEA
jgi:AcrR family transcriptional regulator